MAHDGQLRYAETRNGGSDALYFPPDWLSCERAALISSGPNRPEPLQQFLPGLAGIGLVTGHRLPNRPWGESRLNLAVLEGLQGGLEPLAAIDAVLAAYPECDAGLMAIDAKGDIAYANSARVQRRKDIHSASLTVGGLTLSVMMNSIHFPPSVGRPAELICELAVRTPPMNGDTGTRLLTMADGCAMVHARNDK